MITLDKTGMYNLIETKSNVKILYLDEQRTFAWIKPNEIGQILVTSHVPHRADHALAKGKYHIYSVDDEPYLTDLAHLELKYGPRAWQGYLLPTGLPDDEKKRARIIPTKQTITGNARFTNEVRLKQQRSLTQGNSLKIAKTSRRHE